MIKHKNIISIVVLGIISLFLITESQFLFKKTNLSESIIDSEVEESLEEISENDAFKLSFTESGGDDFHDGHEIKYNAKQFDVLYSISLNVQPKCYFSHSLFILYCCLKIFFC